MGRVIIDISVLILAERSGTTLARLIGEGDDAAVSAVSIAELLVGVELAGPKHRPLRRAFIDKIAATFEVEPYDLSVTEAHAKLLAHARRTGRQRGGHDLIIAATAATHDRTVITLDARGFQDLPGVTFRTP